MKKNCYLLFLIFSIFCLMSCTNEKKSEEVKAEYKLPFKPDMPGSEIVQYYADSTPRIVYYHAVDSAGQPKEEIVGQVAYFEDEKPFMGGGLKDNQREGLWQAFFQNGNLQSEGTYVNGKENGLYRVFHENGKPFYEGNYENGKMVGQWHFYDETGKLVKTETFKGGIQINTQTY